jgi:hypothetical protein
MSLDLPLGTHGAHLICSNCPTVDANCCEFVIITPITLDMWGKRMATKINMIGIIITSDKDDKREKKEHSVFVYPIHSKDDLLWGREQLFVPLIQRVWLQRESHNNYKN